MRYCIMLLLCLGCTVFSFAQEQKDFFSLPQKKQAAFLNSLTNKFSKLDKKIADKTQKTLNRLQKQEKKLYKKLYKKDSIAAKQLFANSEQRYAELQSKLNDATETGRQKKLKEYLPFYDTALTSLSFIDQKLDPANPLSASVTQSRQMVQQFGSRMQVANEIKRQLRDRKKLLAEQLEKFGLTKQLKSLNKEVYYYQEQLNEYKALLKDPKKIEQKAISLLRNSNTFKEFMKKNSIIAQLFKLPEDYGSVASLAGLQTRSSIEAILQQRFAGAGVNPQAYMQQQMDQAQAEMNKLKNKLKNISGGGSSNDIEPTGFKPNNQKTKSFLNRLEYGTNFQTQKMNSYFPVTTDIALSVGYKLNDKSIVGIGASYKLGWGSGIEHIKLSSEGMGLRSFIDWKLKGSFWITGGYEQNYLQRFSSLRSISDINLWRQSALIGLSKKVNVSKKKTTKVQLLYDFFYKKDNIRTQPLVFRVGYMF